MGVGVADRLVITGASCGARGELGPLAWAALETVALDAEADVDGGFGAATTVRKLAVQLDVNKDTAGRALARLIDNGFLVRTSENNESRYELRARPWQCSVSSIRPRRAVPPMRTRFVTRAFVRANRMHPKPRCRVRVQRTTWATDDAQLLLELVNDEHQTLNN